MSLSYSKVGLTDTLNVTAKDFRPNSLEAGEDSAGELWAPERYFWYGEELIPIYSAILIQEERLEIPDSHPIFTGKYPQCGYEFDQTLRLIHWNCPSCGWGDESV